MIAMSAPPSPPRWSTTPPGRGPDDPVRSVGAVPRWARLERGSPVPSDPTTSARRRRERERVFRRRRLAVAVLVALVAFAAGVVLALALMSAPAGGSLTDDAEEARRVHYVVQEGDTLWSAARVLAPETDPRTVVDALVEARGGTTVVAGERLRWPVD